MNQTAMFAIGLLIFTATAFASPEPRVSYSAESTMTMENKTIKSHVYHAQGKERRETEVKSGKSIVILRQDKKKIWMLMPAQKTYIEMAARNNSKSGEPDLSSGHITPLGPETINGLHTEKYKIVIKSKQGETMSGFMWKTADDIVVKYDLASASSRRDGHVIMELSNVRIGKQEPALFEIPSGYAPMDIKGMLINAGIAAGMERHREHVDMINQHMPEGIPAP